MRAVSALLPALVATLAFASPAAAEDEDHFSITPYIWLPTVGGDLNVRTPPRVQEPAFDTGFSVGPVDYLENLNGALMLAGEARFGRVSAFTDFIYLDLSGEAARVRTIDRERVNGTIDAGSSFGLTTKLWTLAAGYDVVRNESFTVQPFVGFRYLGADTTVDWRLTGPFGRFPQSGSAAADSDSWDGIVGVRGEARAGDHWIFPYYVDVGAGDSDLTWQGLVGVGYRFGWGDLRLDYRYLHYEQDDSRLVEELTLDGPAIGATFRF